ncbi:hypothetical protein ACFY8C_16580 [Streptomyces flavochromogenes]|uniref:Uncharacterized protein n=1 Tax=Streptomyces flavochromogenes TaxID=68199 RepID=A0ABW6XR03_9ACTN|nr:hypothetical protein [Streptomyces flavochromogenes]
MNVSIPLDADGFFGRQCPECSMLFRVHGDDYAALPDELRLWCVCCGHSADHGDFWTDQQRERALEAARALGAQIVQQGFARVARKARTSTRRGHVSVSFRSPAPGTPAPPRDRRRASRSYVAMRGMRDPLRRLRRAPILCPSCGRLPAATVAFDALQAETARLDALSSLPDAIRAALREQGVSTRSWVDTIENVVGVVEALGSSVFHEHVTDAEERLRGTGSIFQRLDDMAVLFASAGFPDVRGSVRSPAWQRLLRTWAARHVFTHNDGAVHEKYLRRVPTSRASVGQRLVISDADCREAIEDAAALCRALVDVRPL